MFVAKILEVNTGKIRLKLTVIDFEFHSDFLADEDRQWLEIEANLTIDGISMKSQSPCLMYNELIELKNWYTSLKDNNSIKPLQFIENEISFESDGDKNIYIDFDNQFDGLKEYLNLNGFDKIKVSYNSFKIDTQIQLLQKFIDTNRDMKNR